jgi:hypothetical protein
MPGAAAVLAPSTLDPRLPHSSMGQVEVMRVELKEPLVKLV